MAKPEWGTKRFCQNCGARFYDMRRDPPTCPKCGTPFAPRAVVRQRRNVAAPVAEKVPSPAVATDDLETGVEIPPFEDDIIEDGDEEDFDESEEDVAPMKAEAEDDALIEDASELGEDDDDMSEVMDHVNDTDLTDRS